MLSGVLAQPHLLRVVMTPRPQYRTASPPGSAPKRRRQRVQHGGTGTNGDERRQTGYADRRTGTACTARSAVSYAGLPAGVQAVPRVLRASSFRLRCFLLNPLPPFVSVSSNLRLLESVRSRLQLHPVPLERTPDGALELGDGLIVIGARAQLERLRRDVDGLTLEDEENRAQP